MNSSQGRTFIRGELSATCDDKAMKRSDRADRLESQAPNFRSWVSASQPGSFHIFNESQQFPANADFKPLSFLSVGTKQQSRLKYSHSLMSICLTLGGGLEIPSTLLGLGNPEHPPGGGLEIRSGQVRFITRPKSTTKLVN